MNIRARSVANAGTRTQPGTGFLYGWLLVALFIEYARPASQLTFLNFPFFYSIVPMSLLLVQSFAQGLRPMREIFSDPLAKWIPIFLGIILISWLVAGMGSDGSQVVQTVLGYIFLFILITRIVVTESRLRGVVVTLVVAHLYLIAWNYEVITVGDRSRYIVGGTFLGDGNDYSLSVCILLPLMIGTAFQSSGTVKRVAAWVAVALIILAIIATQSRGGTLALASVLGYLWLHSSRKLLGVAGIVLAVAMVLVYSPPGYFQRMSTVTSMQVDGSAQGRIDAWKGAIGMWAHNPIFGIGPGSFGARWGKTAHSNYFLALAELGLPGLLCVLMLVFGNMRKNLQLRRRVLSETAHCLASDRDRLVFLLNLLTAAAIALAVAGTFLSAIYYPHLFVLSGLLISGRLITVRTLSISAQPEPATRSNTRNPRTRPPASGT